MTSFVYSFNLDPIETGDAARLIFSLLKGMEFRLHVTEENFKKARDLLKDKYGLKMIGISRIPYNIPENIP